MKTLFVSEIKNNRKKIKSVLIECINEVAKDILNDEFLKCLCEKRKKFEGWVQIELAKRLNSKKNQEKGIKDIKIEEVSDNNSSSDIQIITEYNFKIIIEIKFLIVSKSITNSRESLICQINKNYRDDCCSWGLAFMINDNKDRQKWFRKEIEMIENFNDFKKFKDRNCQKKCNIKSVWKSNLDDIICIHILHGKIF